LLAQLLHPATKVILDPEVLRALDRRHERCELALLELGEIQPITLDLQRSIEQRADLGLVGRVPLQYLGAQRLPNLPLISEQAHAVSLESIVHLTELPHLRVVQVESSTDDLRKPLSKHELEPALPLSAGLSRWLIQSLGHER
jgi:hypothetical protein